MNSFDELQFQLDLMDEEWNVGSTDVNLLAQKLVETLTNSLDKHAPLIEKTVTSQWGIKMWWTPEIAHDVKERDRLYKRAMFTRNERDWQNYKQQRNKALQTIRCQKRKYYNEKIDDVKDNSVEMWKTLKMLLKGPVNSGKKGCHFQQPSRKG